MCVLSLVLPVSSHSPIPSRTSFNFNLPPQRSVPRTLVHSPVLSTSFYIFCTLSHSTVYDRSVALSRCNLQRASSHFLLSIIYHLLFSSTFRPPLQSPIHCVLLRSLYCFSEFSRSMSRSAFNFSRLPPFHCIPPISSSTLFTSCSHPRCNAFWQSPVPSHGLHSASSLFLLSATSHPLPSLLYRLYRSDRSLRASSFYGFLEFSRSVVGFPFG